MNRRTNRGSSAGFIACGLLVFFVLALVWSGRRLEGQNFPTIGQMPTSTGGGGSVSNYNQANPLQFNVLTVTNGLTNSSLTAPILSAAGFISSGGSPGILISNTLGAGGDYIAIWTNSMWFCTNAELGKWMAYTNGVLYQSNAVTAAWSLMDGTNFVFSNSVAYYSVTNGHVFSTNYTQSGQSVDIDPSTAGSQFWGDRFRTNALVAMTSAELLASNNLGVLASSGGNVGAKSLSTSNGVNVGSSIIITNGTLTVTSAPTTLSGGNCTLNLTNTTIVLYTNATFNLAIPIMGPPGLETTTEFMVSNSAAANINVVPAAGWKVAKAQGLNSVSTGIATNASWLQGTIKGLAGVYTNVRWEAVQ